MIIKPKKKQIHVKILGIRCPLLRVAKYQVNQAHKIKRKILSIIVIIQIYSIKNIIF
jgi:hypothetical protein